MRSIEFRSDPVIEARRVWEFRELLRGRKHEPMPAGTDGFVVEDLDLVLRWFGPHYGLDEWGRFRYVELKRAGYSINPAQRRTFGLSHCILSERPDRYDGFYVVCHSDDDHNEATTYTVNGQPLTCGEFLGWVLTPYSTIPTWLRHSQIPVMSTALGRTAT